MRARTHPLTDHSYVLEVPSETSRASRTSPAVSKYRREGDIGGHGDKKMASVAASAAADGSSPPAVCKGALAKQLSWFLWRVRSPDLRAQKPETGVERWVPDSPPSGLHDPSGGREASPPRTCLQHPAGRASPRRLGTQRSVRDSLLFQKHFP